jgi:hypothetical protein
MKPPPRADNEAVHDRKHMLIWACVAGSLAVHAVSMVILSILPSPDRPRLVDAPEPSLELSTDLTLAPPEPSPVPEPAVVPPEPSPTPEPTPPPEEPETKPETKPEIAPQPAAVSLPAEPQAPVEEPRPVPPPPSKPAPSVPPAPARVQPSAPKAAPASFAGAKTVRASTIVYAVDASGAMASSLSIVLEELRRSVARLTPDQKFTVILFHESPGQSGGGGHESFSSQPIAATPDNLRKLDAFLATARPGGRSNPLLGLEPALESRPDLIFFLARSIRRSGPGASWGPGKAAVLTRLNELNSVDTKTGRRPVVIKTIQFLEPDPTGLMDAIGTIHGDGPGSAVVYTLPATPN